MQLGESAQGVQCKMVLVFNFSLIITFCFVIAIFDLVHYLEVMSPSLTANVTWKSFLKYE